MAAGVPTFSTPPQPNSQSVGTPSQGPQGQGLDAPASRILRLLADWIRVSQEIGEVHPQISSQMNKVGQSVREALGILAREATQRQGLPTPPEQQLPAQAAQASYPPSGY